MSSAGFDDESRRRCPRSLKRTGFPHRTFDGAAKDLTKFELRVRLAEVEGQISAYRMLFNQPL
jgi:hypothetical protein